MTGDSVKWLQKKLNAARYTRPDGKTKDMYLRTEEIDGDFGTITYGALLAFQADNGLTVDGVCGAKTKAKLK